MSLQRIRLITVVSLAIGTGACASSDPADLIPVGLRASIAAEDKAAQKGPDVKAVSVDDMLSKVRGGKLPPPAPLTAGPAKAEPDPTAAPADVGESAAVAQAAAMTSTALPARTLGSAGGGAPAAPGGVHPLWAAFNTQGRVDPAAGGAMPGERTSSERMGGDDAPAQPLPPLPIAANTVVMHFAGTGSELSADERARLDAAVTLHKATSTGARIVAGPAASGAAFEKLLIAEKRSQAVDQALPESLTRTRDYSPRVEPDTVRVEFSGGNR